MPRVHVTTASEDLGGGKRRVTVTVENKGYLPTHGLWSAAKLQLAEPLTVSCTRAVGEGVRTIGHLEGWGRGKHGSGSWPYQNTSGQSTAARVAFVVNVIESVPVIVPERTGPASGEPPSLRVTE